MAKLGELPPHWGHSWHPHPTTWPVTESSTYSIFTVTWPSWGTLSLPGPVFTASSSPTWLRHLKPGKGAAPTTCKHAREKAAKQHCDLRDGYGVPTVRSSAKYGVIKSLSSEVGLQSKNLQYSQPLIYHLKSFCLLHSLTLLNKCKRQLAAEIAKGAMGLANNWPLKEKNLSLDLPRIRTNWLSFPWVLGCSKCLRSSGNLRRQDSHRKGESWRSLGDLVRCRCYSSEILPSAVCSDVWKGCRAFPKQWSKCGGGALHVTSAGKGRTRWMHSQEAPRPIVDLALALLRLPLEGHQWKWLICF